MNATLRSDWSVLFPPALLPRGHFADVRLEGFAVHIQAAMVFLAGLKLFDPQ